MKFQPIIKWTGSKRGLSEEILSYFPQKINSYYEPFCGGCSMLFQLLNSDVIVNEYFCSDINEHLINFFIEVKENPKNIYNEYEKRWNGLYNLNSDEKRNYYNSVRSDFNKKKNIHDFFFLTRTCVNGLIRYNKIGEFNSAFHFNRDGINPIKLKEIIMLWSKILRDKNVKFDIKNYIDIIPNKNDFMFLDPPYANTTGMYFGNIDLNIFWKYLENLNCNYILTFDGKRTNNDNTYNIPNNLYSKHIYLNKKISGFKKMHKEKDYVEESLYIKYDNNF